VSPSGDVESVPALQKGESEVRTHLPRSTVALAVAAALAVSASAAVRVLTPRTLELRLARLGELAGEAHWGKVEVEAQSLITDLGASLVSWGEVGDESSQLAATVLSFLALAHSAQDRPEEALWHWALAQSLWPDLSRATLSAYGEPAAFLREHRIPPAAYGSQGVAEGEEGEEIYWIGADLGGGLRLEPPVKIAAPAPQYPPGARSSGHVGKVVVRTILGRDGRLQQPYLLDYPSVALGLAAADALRHWRFEPARLDGRPVDAYYNLTVDFSLE
jgi:TonB family protein